MAEGTEHHYSLLHWKSLIGIFLITGFLAISSPIGLLDIKEQELASVVFQVSGTMVALALPAAQFSYALISEFERKLGKIFLSTMNDDTRRKELIDEIRFDLKKHLFPAWRATVYVLVAFILSAAAMILPSTHIPIGATALYFSIDGLFASAALGTVLIGSSWFYPTARYAFSLGLLDKISAELPKSNANETDTADK